MDRNPRRLLDRIPVGYVYFLLTLLGVIAVGAIEHRWPGIATPITVTACVILALGAGVAVWATRRKKHG